MALRTREPHKPLSVRDKSLADTWDKKTVVTFSDSAEIPGQVLPAGTYVFKLANSISDRHIVQIWTGDESQVLATVMTEPDCRRDPTDQTVFEFRERPGDSPMTIHTCFYPDGNLGRQFFYPHR